eukprot:3480067-Amphidinium_carterae.1
MFMNAVEFNQKIGNWNTAKVTDMSQMFAGASKFNQAIGTWNTSIVTDMCLMFAGALAFNSDIISWSVCSVRDMTNMFCDARSFSFLELLRTSWQMAPAGCCVSRRELTPFQVADCLAMLAPASSTAVTPSGSNGSTPQLIILAVTPIVVALLSFLLARRFSMSLRVGAHLSIELEDGSLPFLQEPDYLSLSTSKIGQSVRVTSSEEVLRLECSGAKLPPDDRLRYKGEVGLVLHLDELDNLAWVAFKAHRCQGWFPLACLQDARRKRCHDVLLPTPDLQDLMKLNIIELLAMLPPSEGSISSKTSLTELGRTTTPAKALPRATMDPKEAEQDLRDRPQLLEVNEQDKSSLLGKGTFGTTRVGCLHSLDWNRTEQVAVKLPNFAKETFQEEALKLASITLPGGVPHPFLVQLLAYVPQRCAIVMELCECDLQKFRSKEGPGATLCVAEQVELMEQVGAGCAWIAAKSLVHRDLKMQNILMAKGKGAGGNAKYVPKIADFGLAERTSSNSGVAGTRAYMAPEARAGNFSEKSDVYSFGHVMLGTFCPGRDSYFLLLENEIADWLAHDWSQTDRVDSCVAAAHCKDCSSPVHLRLAIPLQRCRNQTDCIASLFVQERQGKLLHHGILTEKIVSTQHTYVFCIVSSPAASTHHAAYHKCSWILYTSISQLALWEQEATADNGGIGTIELYSRDRNRCKQY